jgi:hypothetical protein
MLKMGLKNIMYITHCHLEYPPPGISLFTKTLRFIIRYWRYLGHKVVMFLDGGIVGHAVYEKAKISSNFVRSSLLEFRFLLADNKCCWSPSRLVSWLGHTIDYNTHCMFIAEERIAGLELSLK